MHGLYCNIGKKIKGLAIGIFLFMFLVFIVIGFYIVLNNRSGDNANLIVAISIIIIGPIVGFLSTWVLYGFGEAVENSYDIMESSLVVEETLVDIKSILLQQQCTENGNANVSPMHASVDLYNDDIEFIKYVENASEDELVRLVSSRNNLKHMLKKWQEAYIISKLDID